ncbi:MAG: trigger factor [Clostridia bacterium]|nr:trigger factor [Clostridia bacterium]
MSYTCEKIASNKAKLTFTIPAADFDAAMQKAFLKLRGRIAVPGFRKGKAPRKMIETLYGESVFYDDAFEIVFPEVYDKALEESGIEAVAQPEVSIDEIGAGQDLKVTCEVFTFPEVTLGQYKGLEVEIDHQVVTDADVDRRIEQDQAKQSRTVEILDRPVEDGDTVMIDYAGTVDGVAFDGGTAENQRLVIGSKSFIPGFEEQIIGMCQAEEKDIDVTFPEEYHEASLAGKPAVFHVKVNTISKSELPELDDDFAADVSDFTTFEEYKADIRRQLEELAEKNNKVAAENALVEKAAANAQMDIPKPMVDRELDRLMRNMEQNMQQQGIPMDYYLQIVGQTREQLAESRRGEAEQQLRYQLTLEAIIKAEGIEATDEEIDRELVEQAEQMGVEPEKLRATFPEDQRGYFKDRANVTKAVELMLSDAKVTDKPEEAPEEEASEAGEAAEDAE